MKKILLILGLLVVGANAESKIYINKFTADKVGKCVLKEDNNFKILCVNGSAYFAYSPFKDFSSASVSPILASKNTQIVECRCK
ncbi:hypothetical protein [Helicobacter pullorum]|uniref:Uncharacterized protein n=1 Tax=Helicobacter pullorum TaxID=35818 RepID=A0A0N1MQP3_9HELI|nr:hypothetical protein [Helicobacter pullorum]KPH55464.1 hypothetical protein HPU229334_08445 [Helicobacter pullorum]